MYDLQATLKKGVNLNTMLFSYFEVNQASLSLFYILTDESALIFSSQMNRCAVLEKIKTHTLR